MNFFTLAQIGQLVARSSALATVSAALLLSAASTGRAQTSVYDQTSATEDEYYAWGSEIAPGVSTSLTYDNFTLTTAADVTVVQWEGIYLDDNNLADNPAPENTTSFTISFWSDNDGQPGAQLATTEVMLGDCDPVTLGDIEFDFSNTSSVQVPHIAYSATLSAPFTAAAGVPYWISIQSSSTSAEPGWALYSGEGGDGSCVQDYAGTRYTRPSDIRFSLLGDVVTTPTVTVAASTPVARLGGTPGVFTFTLSAPQSTVTKVRYKVKGSAVNGTDYVMLSGSAKIKAGKTSVNVTVVPKGDLESASSKKVKLTVTPESADYTIGTDGVAQIKIVNH